MVYVNQDLVVLVNIEIFIDFKYDKTKVKFRLYQTYDAKNNY